MTYSRYSGLPKLFASNLEDKSNRLLFGTTYSSDDIDHNLNENYKIGWEIIGDNNFPSLQDFNAFFYTQSYLISYLYQSGVPEWSEDRSYNYGSIINYKGDLYIDKNSDSSKINKNKNPEIESEYWDKFYSNNTNSNIIVKPTRAFNVYKENFTAQASEVVSTIANYSRTINIGNCFDKNTGKFTCDKSGVYRFNVTLSYRDPSTSNDDSMDWILLRNGVPTLVTSDDPAQSLRGSQVGNLTLSYNKQLVAGDVISFGYRKTHMNIDIKKIIFSGWLL